MADFKSFIGEQIRRYGTAQKLADKIGMSLSAFSRGVRNEGTLNVENCLRLAEETGENPSHVLRLAGKGSTADLIERLYGRARSPLSGGDRELLALWQLLNHEADGALRTLLRALARESGQKQHKNTA